MRGGKKIRIAFYLLAAGGAALFTLLLVRQGAPHVIAAFASAGWTWGGDFTSVSDLMHFSANGR